MNTRRYFLTSLGSLAATPLLSRDFGPGAPPVRYPEPDVIALDKAFEKYKIGSAPIERLHTGMYWAEGPAWSGWGQYLVWSDIPNNIQHRWLQDDGEITTIHQPAGHSNGNTFDREGRQISFEHGNRRVVRYETDNSITVLADKFDGKPFNAPNDGAVHPDGSVWFTDPGYGSLGNYEGNKGDLLLKEAVYRIDPSGKIYVAAGSCPQGQGMETVFAQVAADCWKVRPEDVVLTFADTAAIPMGFGTIASRSTVTLSASIHHASERVRRKVFAIASNVLECAEQDLELRDGRVGVVGVPGASMTLAQVAAAARPGWDHRRPEGTDAGLESTFYWEPPTVTWSYAAHAVVVDVDVELGKVSLENYVIAHDCGVLVNPMLAEGQIVGGAVQGIGGAMLEEFLYDPDGQLLAGSFMEYLLPSAADMPRITVLHEQSASPSNPLGVKGLGEGGAIGPPVAIANAVSDALAPYGVEFNDTPITPQRVFEAARGRKAA